MLGAVVYVFFLAAAAVFFYPRNKGISDKIVVVTAPPRYNNVHVVI
jgi:hypothetical protein